MLTFCQHLGITKIKKIHQPIRIEGFFPIFSLMVFNPKIIVEITESKCSNRKPPIHNNQMANLNDIYELIDISSEIKNNERSERASTPLPKDTFPNIRVILEISHSSIEANADLEEDLNSSLGPIDMDCKRLKLDNSFETVESGEYPNSPGKYQDGEIIESPESPDECNTIDITNSESS